MTTIDEIKKIIKSKKIKPKSKLHFFAINFGWWFLFILLFVISSIAFGVMVYIFKGADWEVSRLVATSFWGRLALVVPRLWILLIIITTIIAVWEFRKTKKGYRYDIVVILGIVLIGSIILGSVVYASGLGGRLDSFFTDNMQLYRGRLHQQMDLWDRADSGLLMGRVLSHDEVELSLQAPLGLMWSVDVSSIEGVVDFETGSVVKIIGQKVDDNHFMADSVNILEMERFKGGHKPPMKHFMPPMGNDFPGERFPMHPAY